MKKRKFLRVFQFQGKGEGKGGVCGGDLTTGLTTGGDVVINPLLVRFPAAARIPA